MKEWSSADQTDSPRLTARARPSLCRCYMRPNPNLRGGLSKEPPFLSTMMMMMDDAPPTLSARLGLSANLLQRWCLQWIRTHHEQETNLGVLS